MPLFRFLVLVLVASLMFPALVTAEPGDYGYEGPVNTGVGAAATGEKPESKLWWNDGAWWAVLYSPSGSAHHIHRLDVATQQWIDTGVPVDPRESSRADVLWHDASGKLYVASRGVGGGRLLRFSYSSATDTYSNDAGSGTTIQMALITASNPETLTLDRDSTGQLWAAWEIGSQVMVNRSLGSDADWGAAFVLPVAGATDLDADDIASVVAFDNSKIGVMWSNQNDDHMYFAVHLDSADDSTWEARSIAFGGAGNADDHINLKSLQADPDSDRVFAAIKTSRSNDPDPMVVLLRYDRSEGWWDAAVFGTEAEQHTRPQIMLDTTNRLVHMFATSPESSNQTQTIYCKTTNMDAPRGAMTFPAGLGEPVLRDASDNLNNPTSSKQNVSIATGLVVVASGSGGRYWHHYNALATPGCNGVADPGGGPQPPAVPAGLAASPGDGQVGLSWNAVSGATEYHLKRATTSGGPYTTIASPTSPGHTDTNVTNGTTYFYVVSAQNAAGESLDSAEVSATPSAGGGGTFTPSQDAFVKQASPTTTFNTGLLQVRGGANKQYTFLQFDLGSSSGNATLRLFVTDASIASGNVYAVSSGWSEGSLTWSTMPPLGTQRATSQAGPAGTWISFDLGAVGPGIVSLALANSVSDIVGFASSESANPPQLIVDGGGGPQPPAVPAGLAASPGDGQVGLSWNAVSGATEYHLKRATTSGGPYTTIASPTSPGHTDTNVTNGTTYFYVVSAQNAAGESLDSAEVSATPNAGPQPPAVPAGLAASPGDGQVGLSWNAVSGATEYHLKRATTSGGPYTTIASPTSPGHTDTNVTNGTTYFYVVSAQNAAGESLDSAEVSATPSAGGGGTFTPNQDAFVKQAYPTTTFNTDVLHQRAGGDKQYIFLQFDLGSSSGNATLRLFVTDASIASGNVYAVSSGWSEGSLTWSTMPPLGTQRAASQAAAIGTWISFDLGPVGPGIVSLALAFGSSDVVKFASSESANPPELIVAGG